MKYCSNCGQRLDEGAGRCPNCGAVVPAEKKRRRRWPIVAVCTLVVAAVIAVGAVFVPRLFMSGPERFVEYQAKLIARPIADYISRSVDRAADPEFKSDLTVTLDVDNDDISPFLDGSDILLKVDSSKDRFLLGAQLDMLGTALLTPSMSVEDGRLSVSIPQADGNMYIVDLNRLAESAGLDLGHVRAPDVSGEDAAKLLLRYGSILAAAVTEDNLTVEKDCSLTYKTLEGAVDVTLYTFRPTADDIERTLLSLADALETDRELRDVLSELTLSEGDGRVDDAILDLVDNIRADAGDVGRAVAGGNFTWRLAVEGSKVRSIALTMNDGGIGIEMSGSEKSGGLTTSLYMIDNGQVEAIMRSVSSLSGSQRSLDLDLWGEGASISGSFKYDEDKLSPLGVPEGDYSFTVSDPNGTGGVTAALTVSENEKGGVDHRLTLRGDPYPISEDFTTVTVNVNAAEGTTVQPPAGTPVDVTGYSPEQLEALLEDIAASLGANLLDSLGLGLLMDYGL